MKELIEILLGIAAFVCLVWLYIKFLEVRERILGHPPESLGARWLKRRNRPITIFGKNDEDVL